MIRGITVLVVVIFGFLSAGASETDVVVLTTENFDEFVSQGIWMVEFYAPWCGHCKKLAPVWENFATEMKGKIKVGKVDCTVQKALQQRYGIRGFPTLKYFSDGKVYDYTGARSMNGFTKYVKGGYKKAESTSAGLKATPTNPRRDTGKPNQNAPTKQARTASPQKVIELTDKDFRGQTARGIWMVKFYVPWCGHCKALAPVWNEYADKETLVKVAQVDCTANKKTCTQFGIKGYPKIKLFTSGKAYDFKGPRTVEEFQKYTQGDYLKNTGLTYISESSHLHEADVVDLTAANFNSKVASGIWFVEFYAPWCGHCKRLAPIWEELAETVKGRGMNIAKVDCTVEKSLATRFSIKGFPTLKLIADGRIYDYRSARQLKDLQAFLEGGYKNFGSKLLKELK